VSLNSSLLQGLTVLQQYVYQMKFRNVVKSEVTGRACIGLEQNGIDTAAKWMEKASPCLCSHSGPTL